jgi:hypothetical protein
VLDIEELKSVPFAPRSHPFIERLIGTLRREYLDRTFFWNGVDSIASWLVSPPITTSDASTPDSVAGHPSSDARQLQANRRHSITTLGDQTVPVSSTRQSLRD